METIRASKLSFVTKPGSGVFYEVWTQSTLIKVKNIVKPNKIIDFVIGRNWYSCMNMGWRVGYQREGSSYCYLAPLPSLSISSPQLSVSQSPDSIHQKLPQPLSRTLPGMSNNCPRFWESFQHWTFRFRFACFCRYFVSSVKSVCRSSWPVKIVPNAQSLYSEIAFSQKRQPKVSSRAIICLVLWLLCVVCTGK